VLPETDAQAHYRYGIRKQASPLEPSLKPASSALGLSASLRSKRPNKLARMLAPAARRICGSSPPAIRSSFGSKAPSTFPNLMDATVGEQNAVSPMRSQGRLPGRTASWAAGAFPAAVFLAQRGGLKGGKARAETMTPERRAEIAKKAARSSWKGELFCLALFRFALSSEARTLA
jgi:hypothetical protein